jgi:hypothetical protein
MESRQMAEVGPRDRLVMAGLVVLGLLTVVAGVLSGRSLRIMLCCKSPATGSSRVRAILDASHHHPSRRAHCSPVVRTVNAVTIIETFVLPLAFGALALASIMTVLWWVVISTKIKLEDEALGPRRKASKVDGDEIG